MLLDPETMVINISESTVQDLGESADAPAEGDVAPEVVED